MSEEVERFRNTIRIGLQNQGLEGLVLTKATQLALVTALSIIQNEIDKKKERICNCQTRTEYHPTGCNYRITINRYCIGGN